MRYGLILMSWPIMVLGVKNAVTEVLKGQLAYSIAVVFQNCPLIIRVNCDADK